MAHHENHQINKTTSSDSDFSPLNRQYTVNLTPDQYERLFFQPTQAKGDLSKRLGNPTLLGLLGFLVPFTSTMFCLLEFKGANAGSLPALTSIWYFYGGTFCQPKSLSVANSVFRNVYGTGRIS